MTKLDVFLVFPIRYESESRAATKTTDSYGFTLGKVAKGLRQGDISVANAKLLLLDADVRAITRRQFFVGFGSSSVK
jgi:hypothetical protein